MAFDRISPPSALLLLPPPPSFTFEQVKGAFEPSVSDACARISKVLGGSNRIASLDIALAIPDLRSQSCRPQARVFAPLQQYLTSIYTLIGAVCSTKSIELDSPGGIDTRVVFIDCAPSGDAAAPQPSFDRSRIGPILNMQSLASSGRRWDYVFYPDNTAGKNLADAFINNICFHSEDRTAPQMQAISSNPDWTVPPSLLVPDDRQPPTPHYSVIVGGTFDNLHVGHKLLLTATALAMEPLGLADSEHERLLTVGLTGDALLVNKKYAEFLESWDERYQSTASFLSAIMDFRPPERSAPRVEQTTGSGPNSKFLLLSICPHLKLKFVEISDPFGPTITEESISALVVSKETRAGGAAVNDERAKKGWKKLAIFEVDVLQSGEAADPANFESKISSTDIRRRRMHMAKV